MIESLLEFERMVRELRTRDRWMLVAGLLIATVGLALLLVGA